MHWSETLTEKSTVLTPSIVEMNRWVDDYNQYQQQNKHLCWTTLDILPWDRWVERLWNEYCLHSIKEHPHLLTPYQATKLWEQIIVKETPLLFSKKAAQSARSTWHLCQQWHISISQPLWQQTIEGQAWQTWAHAYQATCAQNQWVDPAVLAQIVSDKICNREIQLPKQLLCVDFERFTPQQHDLLNACQASGCLIIYDQTKDDTKTSVSHRIDFEDEETEMRTMARWAKYQLTHMTDNPSANIACIVPDLEQRYTRLQTLFSEIFADSEFHIHLDEKMIDSPLIQSALDCLRCYANPISFDLISRLLLSPFIGTYQEEKERILFELQLRRYAQPVITLESLCDTHESPLSAISHCQTFSVRLIALRDLMQTSTRALDHPWATVFKKILNLFDWPGDHDFSPHDQWVIQRLIEKIDEFEQCETLLTEMQYPTALQHFIDLIEETMLPQHQGTASLHIMTPTQANALSFEYAWMMGCNDNTWPASPTPNTIIPLALQKAAGIPNLTYEDSREESRRLFKSLMKKNHDFILSYARQTDQGTLRPSAWIEEIHKRSDGQLPLADDLSKMHSIFMSRQLEHLEDSIAPPFPAHQKVPGGATLFKYQAACPFKAFTQLRLYALALEQPSLGLRPQERGTLIHHALEYLWKTLKNSDVLAKQDDSTLKALIHHCVQSSLQHIHFEYDSADSRALEMERHEALIFEWLQQEKKRPPFEVIAHEVKQIRHIGEHAITLRMDRIDKCRIGGKLIIDYKTGTHHSILAWFGDRPDEPQLPLYCLTDTLDISGISFAQLAPGHLKWIGVSQEALEIEGIKAWDEIPTQKNTPTWDRQLSEWKFTLEKLGHDFLEGIAVVDPKNPEKTCRHCPCQSLCRIHEKAMTP